MPPDWRHHSQNLIDNLSTHLTRRANHRHIFIIATIQKLAPGNRLRAFSIVFSVSDGGRTSWRHIHPCTAARSVASGPPSEPLLEFRRCARTCRHAAWQKSTAARGLHLMEIRFAPEMIALIMPHIYSYGARGRNDRVSDRTSSGRPRCHCSVGGAPVSAEIIRLMA